MNTSIGNDAPADLLGAIIHKDEAARLRRLWAYSMATWAFFGLALATFVALFTTTRDLSTAVGSGYLWFSGALLAAPYFLTAVFAVLVWSDGERWNRGARHGLHTQWQGALAMAASVLLVVPFWLVFIARSI